MNGTPFKLATFAKPRARQAFSPPSCSATRLSTLGPRTRPIAPPAASDLERDRQHPRSVGNWDANFALLQEIVAFIEKEVSCGCCGARGFARVCAGAAARKMFYAAQNFQEHVDEMIRAGMTPAGGVRIHRREIDVAPLPIPQGAEHAAPAPSTKSRSRAA